MLTNDPTSSSVVNSVLFSSVVKSVVKVLSRGARSDVRRFSTRVMMDAIKLVNKLFTKLSMEFTSVVINDTSVHTPGLLPPDVDVPLPGVPLTGCVGLVGEMLLPPDPV